MLTLKEAIFSAKNQKSALGHFNVSNLETAWAIGLAAREVGVPVIVGLSEGEGQFFGLSMARAVVSEMARELNHPIYLNADHSYSLERVISATKFGYDAVIFDGAKKSLAENLVETKKAVIEAKKIRGDILIEGELGYIGTSSQMMESLPEGVSLENLTTKEEAQKFVLETGVDLFAPAVGNVHGILAGGNPKLNIERIKEIAEAIPQTPLVLHGGSGLKDQEFKEAILAGICIVHINTELRVEYRKSLENTLLQNPKETTPYKILAPVRESLKNFLVGRIRLFAGK